MAFGTKLLLADQKVYQPSGATLTLEGSNLVGTIAYIEDVSADYSLRSLVDKEYVDNLVETLSGDTELLEGRVEDLETWSGETQPLIEALQDYTGTTDGRLDNLETWSGVTDGRLEDLEELTSVALTGATNGLTKVGDHDVEFGGELTKDTTIGGDNGTYSLSLGIEEGSNLKNFSVDVTDDINIKSKSTGIFTLFGNNTSVNAISTGTLTLNANADNVILIAAPTGAVPLAVSTVGYVNDLVETLSGDTEALEGRVEALETWSGETDIRLDVIEGQYVTGATNGLSKDGDHDVELGGELTKGTTIIIASGSSLFIEDTRDDTRGIKYVGDYSTYYTERSLVDKGYVDVIATGLVPVNAVLVATTEDIALSGLTIVDGVQLSDGDRVLVKDQLSGETNGIYVATGDTWQRAEDYDGTPEGEVRQGNIIPIITGDTQGNQLWVLVTSDPIIVGTTPLLFTRFSKPLDILAGNGIDIDQVGSQKTVSVDLLDNGGLQFVGDELAINQSIDGNGLDLTNGVLSIDLDNNSGLSVSGDGLTIANTIDGNGIDFTNGVLSVDLATNSGLYFAGAGDDELSIDPDIAGDGLTWDNGVLSVDLHGVGLTGATNGLDVDGQDVILGGQLNQATEIDINSQSLTFLTNPVEYGGDYSAQFELNSLTDWRSVVTVVPITETANFMLSGTSYLGKAVIVTNANEVIVTIPEDATYDYPVGTMITIQQGGEGIVTAEGEGGVTVVGQDGELSTTKQYGFVQYWKTGADEWVVVGGGVELWEVSGTTLRPVDDDHRIPVKYIEGLGDDLEGLEERVEALETWSGETQPIIEALQTYTGVTDGRLDNLETWSGVTDGRLDTIETTFITGATNGLDVDGQNVKLGGTLSENTQINLSTFNFSIDNGGDLGLWIWGGATDGILLNNTGGSYVYIEGVANEIILNTPNNVDITGTVLLRTTPATGSTSDAVLVWNSGDKQIKQIDASNLGEDNNDYSKLTVTGATALDADSPYVILVNHDAPVTITLPATPFDGQAFKIKDASGDALTNNITIDGDENNIDNATEATINTDWGAVEVMWDEDLGIWLTLSFIN